MAKNFKRFYFDYEIRKKRGMTKSLIVSVMATKVYSQTMSHKFLPRGPHVVVSQPGISDCLKGQFSHCISGVPFFVVI